MYMDMKKMIKLVKQKINNFQLEENIGIEVVLMKTIV